MAYQQCLYAVANLKAVTRPVDIKHSKAAFKTMKIYANKII